ncbi:MAG: PAS domain S-box protein [Pseudomonadales bacterium]|nr:PAS domain S-box protein [Pseudomonadales bacterium]
MLSSLFIYPDESLLIYGNYDLWLVALSVLIAIFTSAMALHMASQARKSSASRTLTLFIGSVALGGGVWSMHFIGMLAFDLCTPVEYDWWLTSVSVIPSIAASVIALNLNSQKAISQRDLWVGGVLMGAGIGSMHYLGMAGMEMAPVLRYDPLMFSLSIVVAIVLSVLALWIRTGIRRFATFSSSPVLGDIAGGIGMGVAISGMHYVGMAAARFVPPADFVPDAPGANLSTLLALGVSFATVVITSLVVAVDLVLGYKRLSHKLKLNEERVRGILQTAVDGIIIIDYKGSILELNRAAEQLLGWSQKELLTKNIKMLMPEAISSQHDGYLENYMKTRIAKIIGQGRQVEAKHKNGDLIPVRLAIGHVQFADEDLFVGFLTDVREQTKMQNELRENEARFRSLIGNIPGAAYRCLCSDHWEMIFISDAIETITGYPAKEFMLPNPKRYFADLILPQDQITPEELMTKPGSFQVEYRITHRDGSVRWIQDSGECINDENGYVLWVDGFMMDVTKRKELDIELVNAKLNADQAAQTRAAFLANMSHEIRTPMNSIIGFSDILMSTKLNKEQHGYLKTLNNSAVSLLHLLNDVLDLSKLEKGKVTLEIVDFSLQELVDAVTSTFWIQAKSKDLKLEVNLSNGLEAFYKGSPDRIRQVLNNIVGNAIKFTEQGGVSVEVSPMDGSRVKFCVRDTGIGIDEARVKSIFEPFTQADSSMSRRFGGTGLGTTISNQLVQLMGGELKVDTKLGEGSCFYFDIPLAKGAPVEDKSQFYDIELPPLDILAADDVSQNLELLRIRLENVGHRLTLVKDGIEAVEEVKQHSFDLVLMDIQMPRLDGLGACKAIREWSNDAGNAPPPIIAMTASVMQSDKEAAIQAGMSGFCNKPVEFSQLFQEIARVLGLPQVIRNRPKYHSEQPHCSFNLQRGESLWGDKATYVRELRKFLERLETEVVPMQRNLEKADFKSLSEAAHKLKGVSGNLSVTSLQQIFEQLENEAIEKNLNDCSNRLHSICTLVRQLKSEAEDLDDPDTESPQTSQTCDIDEIKSAIEKLISSAARNACDDTALSIVMGQSNQLGTVEVERLEEAFNNFDFSVAIKTLEQFLEKLDG